MAVEIDEELVFRDLQRAPEALWSFLLTAGYLKVLDVRWTASLPVATLAIPNREVQGVWRRQFSVWLEQGVGGGAADVEDLLTALLAGDAQTVQRVLRTLVRNTLSYRDTPSGPHEDPERVYQAFVLGLLVWLEPRYKVRSNRESGYGRADVLLIPREAGKPGVVLELKRLWTDEEETPEAGLADAHAQIERCGYTSELEAAGASPIHALAVVFDGKRVWVR